MNSQNFNEIVRAQLEKCTSMLCGKAKEYATDDERLHNFKVASVIQGRTMVQALGGMMCKHTTSIYDMIESGQYYPLEKWDEKITDHINYLLILAAVIREEKNKHIYQVPDDVNIIAVDFDGCLCGNRWPEIGEPNKQLIDSLSDFRKQGGKVILWTCREGDALEKAACWCKELGLEFDAVNANLPEQAEKFGNDCRKIGADLYLDDKARRLKAGAE